MTTLTKQVATEWSGTKPAGWDENTQSDLDVLVTQGKTDGVWSALPNGHPGGTYKFIDQAAADEWVTLQQTRSTLFNRPIVSIVVSDITV